MNKYYKRKQLLKSKDSPNEKERLQLEEAYMVIIIYKKCTYDTVKRELEKIIIKMRNYTIKEMNAFANTLSKWKYEIINSFIVIGESMNKDNHIIHRRISNGIIENRNKSIELLKHSSNGYLNWERFRARVLYCLIDDTTFKNKEMN